MRHVLVALAAGLMLALAGCVPSAPPASPTPHPIASPVFASDADALKAAESAYSAYLKVSDQIANDGGKNPQLITELVSPERLPVELRGSKALSDRGIHTVGFTTFSNASLEQIASSKDTKVSFYACWDASSVRVLDSTGSDVTPAARVSKQTLEIVVRTINGKQPMVLESDEVWSESSFC